MLKTALILALGVITLALLFKLLLMKRDLKQIRKELDRTREEDYDRQLSVTLLDKDMEETVAALNRNLDYQKQLKLREERSRRQLEQSVSDIAHDLRTPLTVIRGNLSLLKDEELSREGRECLAACERRSESLKNMVDEFFELSLLESGDVSFAPEDLDITAFLAEFIIDNESLIRSRDLTPKIELPEKSVILSLDRRMLTRIMGNLLNNVCKYAEGSFTLRLLEEGTLVRLSMENRLKSGEAPDTEHIFERTYRADKARSDGSAGLGLYIVKLLIERMGGSIAARKEGGKLSFILEFPKKS
ncbi:MAG: HAMP domain-containing histidine kinase [Lachnospiraceae bacterium]|nr:HAMP domain-containing histidine kinase [Lachnospiraceae bacterium]